MKILVTCPPMLGMMQRFAPLFDERGLRFDAPEVKQVLSEEQLIKCIADYDGWIIGDDPATRAVFEAGARGHLKAAVKWGVGVDNVDLDAARELGIPVANTPQMFGNEVADVALGYLIALARDLFAIDRSVRAGGWSKPRGISLAGRRASLVGFGDIGQALARRLLAVGMRVTAHDPYYRPQPGLEAVVPRPWPEGLEEADALLFACALTPDNRHMLGARELERARPGLRVVNVSRGPLIDEAALADALEAGSVHSAALDVFEQEPLPADSRLRGFGERVLFGAHNSSNTEEGVIRASELALDLLCGFMDVGDPK